MTAKCSEEIPVRSADEEDADGQARRQGASGKVVVLGIGNILLSDEGVGVHAIKTLASLCTASDVEIVDGGTAGMELLPLIEGADHLVVVDAICCGRPPGSIMRLEGAQVPAYFKGKLSPHQVGLSELLAALAFKGTAPRQVVLIGVEPATLSLGLELSPAVKARLEEVVCMVGAELASIGHPVS